MTPSSSTRVPKPAACSREAPHDRRRRALPFGVGTRHRNNKRPAAEGGLMDERDVLAERFDAERGRLRAVAYGMLVSLAEAEDAVQEAWLRLARSDESAIENLGGWLTT